MQSRTNIIGWVLYTAVMLAIVASTVIAARAGIWGAYPEPTVRYVAAFTVTDPVLGFEPIGGGIWIVHDGDEVLFAGDLGACLDFAGVWGSYPTVKGPRGTAAGSGRTD